MARIDIRLNDKQKEMLQAIAIKDNRNITKELIQLIEERYKILGGK